MKIREITNCAYSDPMTTPEAWIAHEISLNEGTPDCFMRTALPLIAGFEAIIQNFMGYYFWVADFMEPSTVRASPCLSMQRKKHTDVFQ